jgi:hypothetical protein
MDVWSLALRVPFINLLHRFFDHISGRVWELRYRMRPVILTDIKELRPLDFQAPPCPRGKEPLHQVESLGPWKFKNALK